MKLIWLFYDCVLWWRLTSATRFHTLWVFNTELLARLITLAVICLALPLKLQHQRNSVLVQDINEMSRACWFVFVSGVFGCVVAMWQWEAIWCSRYMDRLSPKTKFHCPLPSNQNFNQRTNSIGHHFQSVQRSISWFKNHIIWDLKEEENKHEVKFPKQKKV